MSSGIWLFMLVSEVRVNWVVWSGEMGKKIQGWENWAKNQAEKLGENWAKNWTEKLGGKNWAKNWVNWRIFYEVITQLLRDYFAPKVGMN